MASAKATFVTILLVAATIGAVPVRDIPEFLHVCNTQEPNYESCVTDSIHYLKQELKSGVPEYNIPSLEPLKLDRLEFTPTSTITLQARDIDVYGASNFTITKLKIDLDNLEINVDVALPNIIVDGQYEIDGKLLLLPIRGSGAMHGNFTNCLGSCKIKGVKYMDEDVEKVHVDDFKLEVDVGAGTLILDDLFDGEQALGDVINTSINNNFDLFAKEVMPLIAKALSNSFQDIADNIVKQFSYAQLFPK